MADMYLGIDPSSVATGWGVVDDTGDLIDWGVIKPNKKKLNEPQQAAFQYEALSAIMEKYDIKGIACEDQHKGPNPDTFKKLSRISGYVMLLAGQHDVPFLFVHPSSWRKAVLGKGNAKKEDSLIWVKERYQLLLSMSQNDIAEGIAIANSAMFHFMGEKKHGSIENRVG